MMNRPGLPGAYLGTLCGGPADDRPRDRPGPRAAAATARPMTALKTRGGRHLTAPPHEAGVRLRAARPKPPGSLPLQLFSSPLPPIDTRVRVPLTPRFAGGKLAAPGPAASGKLPARVPHAQGAAVPDASRRAPPRQRDEARSARNEHGTRLRSRPPACSSPAAVDFGAVRGSWLCAVCAVRRTDQAR